MDHPPVRPRGAGRQRHQAAGRRDQRRPERRRRAAAGARQPARHRRLLRHEPLLRRPRHLLDGRQRDRRGGAQLRGRRRRSGADRHPRQLLLGQHRPARNARLAGPRGHRPATTWRPCWARRSSAARTASTTNSGPQGAAEPISIPPSLLDQRPGPGRRRRADA